MAVLLELCGEGWQLEVVGKPPEMPPFLETTATTTLVTDGQAELRAYDSASRQLVTVEPGDALAPLFLENATYDLYLRAAHGQARVDVPAAAKEREHRTRDLQHVTVNFRNDVGFSDLQVTTPGRTVTVQIEVFPRKIDYRSDFVTMRDEVAGIVRNLVLTVNARTYGQASPSPERNPTLNEWWSLLKGHFEALMRSARAIADNPHSRLEVKVEAVPVERARKVSERHLDRLLRRPVARPEATIPGTGVELPARVPQIRRRISYDTPENRYFKALLLQTQSNLQRIVATEATGDEDADLNAEQCFFREARPQAREMLRHLRGFVANSYLKQVATVPAKRPASMVFLTHPHYSAFARIARIVNGGLTLDGGPLRTGLKNVALLYEYWCFLRLIQMLREELDLEQQSIIKTQHLKTTVVLRKGKRSTIRFRDRATGKSVLLVYNRLFKGLPTAPQQPDNVIQLAGPVGVHIFDAKYRLQWDPDYLRQYGGVGPTVDDINTMHRYKDAIVSRFPTDQDPFVRIVKEALVLFPFPGEAQYASHRFFRSVESVQIGGFPLLPGTSSLLLRHLAEMLRQERVHTNGAQPGPDRGDTGDGEIQQDQEFPD